MTQRGGSPEFPYYEDETRAPAPLPPPQEPQRESEPESPEDAGYCFIPNRPMSEERPSLFISVPIDRLKELEWLYIDDCVVGCPVCQCEEGRNHDEDCWLGKWLAQVCRDSETAVGVIRNGGTSEEEQSSDKRAIATSRVTAIQTPATLAGETRTEPVEVPLVGIRARTWLTGKKFPDPKQPASERNIQWIAEQMELYAEVYVAAAASRIAQLQALIDAANQRFKFYGVSAEEDLETGIDNVYVKGSETAEAALTQAQQERDALLQEKKRDMEKVHLEWSDRGGDWHPTEFWEAVRSCALDHHYDRTSDGVPYGVPDIYRVEFAPVVARHLSAVNPNWKDETVYQMTKERQDIFETELKDVNARVYEQVKEKI